MSILPMTSSKPRVSVLVITYNHEKYLAQALDSILSQRVNFPFEVVVGEDKSPDRTLQIALDYQAQHPDIVRVLDRGKNLGITANLIDSFAQCHGDFVAILEGDDYWLSPTKLQHQVDFLDANPTFSMCHTNCVVIDEHSGQPTVNRREPDWDRILGVEDFFQEHPVVTCTVMVRNGMIKEWPNWFHKLKATDLAFCILHAELGPVGYLKEVSAVYRKHSEGYWVPLPIMTKCEDVVLVRKVIDEHLHRRHHLEVIQACAETWAWGAGKALDDGDKPLARRLLLKSWLTAPLVKGEAKTARKRLFRASYVPWGTRQTHDEQALDEFKAALAAMDRGDFRTARGHYLRAQTLAPLGRLAGRKAQVKVGIRLLFPWLYHLRAKRR